MDTQPGPVFIPHDNDVQSPQNSPQESTQLPQAAQSSQTQPAVDMPPTQDTPAHTGYTSTASVPPEQSSYNTTPVAQDSNWQYNTQDDSSTGLLPLPDDVTWSAAEFIEHQKSAGWYGLLFLAGLLLAGLDFLLLRDFISTVIIIFVTIMFAAYAGHKPRMQQYHLSPQGLQIGEKFYAFQGFKNFSIAEEGSHTSIVFMPLRRFMPLLTVYLTPDVENQAVDYLSNFLPLEQHRADVIDGLLKRIKF